MYPTVLVNLTHIPCYTSLCPTEDQNNHTHHGYPFPKGKQWYTWQFSWQLEVSPQNFPENPCSLLHHLGYLNNHTEIGTPVCHSHSVVLHVEVVQLLKETKYSQVYKLQNRQKMWSISYSPWPAQARQKSCPIATFLLILISRLSRLGRLHKKSFTRPSSKCNAILTSLEQYQILIWFHFNLT